MLVAVCAAGCGAAPQEPAARIERAFTTDWHDHADSVDVRYTTTRIVFHDGRWTANVTVTNRSDKPLYEATWAPAGWRSWNGPALVYQGLDVLGARRLIYVPAASEEPRIPYPLRPGATWRGTVVGKIPAAPALPRNDEIWLRYPVFGIGQPWDGVNNALAVQWISDKSVAL